MASHFIRCHSAPAWTLRLGSFFESVPGGVDVYMLKSVLHDWSDVDCRAILQSVGRAAGPHSKLLVVEQVVEAGNGPQSAKWLDLQMLVATHGGRERTESEWRELLSSSGFELERIIPTRGPMCLLESRPVP